ncbi:MAG: tetratricopeptide repeat protein [Geitlerinemataceae cyanobacterium]
MGLAYQSLGQVERAIDLHQQSLKIKREIGDRQGEALSLGNMGDSFASLQRYPEAIEHLEAAISRFEVLQIAHRTPYYLDRLAAVQSHLKQYDSAIEAYQKAIAIRLDRDEKKAAAKTMQLLQQLLNASGRVQEGWAIGQQAGQLLIESGAAIDDWMIPQWQKKIAHFAKRGTGQFLLCFLLGLLAFPFFVVWFVALLLFRLLRRPFLR